MIKTRKLKGNPKNKSPQQPDMKPCPECGYDIPATYRKCNVCGKWIAYFTTDTSLFVKYKKE